MSVLGGLWHLNGEPAGGRSLEQMRRATQEYGPDGTNIYVNGSITMLFQANHCTPESHYEVQPQIMSSGSILLWDGRLDNREELIAALGNTLHDKSDAAIVAAALDRWQMDAFGKFVGDWALSMWNPSGQELVLARDYIGIRKLFYSATPDRVRWCSYLPGLVLSGHQLSLNDDYVTGFLLGYPDVDLTPYREIQAVKPGYAIRIKPGKISQSPYWALNPERALHLKKDADYEEAFLELFRESVRCRLRSDSTVLAGLSGGYDSSAVVCMADDIVRAAGSGSSVVDTFSFYDRDEPDDDDFEYIGVVEHHRNRKGHHVALSSTGDTFICERRGLRAVPGFGERQELAAELSKIAEQGRYRVILSGEGGDELQGQALDCQVALADMLARFDFAEFGQQLIKWGLVSRRPLLHLVAGALIRLFPRDIQQLFQPKRHMPWLHSRISRKKRLAGSLYAPVLKSWITSPKARDCIETYDSLSRKISFASGSRLDTRYPYLDQRLLEFLLAIPIDQVLRPGQRRSLMKRSLRDLLPSEIQNRRTKAGTGRCVSLTVEKNWRLLQENLASGLSCRFGFIDPKGLEKTLREIKAGRTPVYLISFLKALSLELWMNDVVKRGVISIPASIQAYAEAA